MNCYAEWRDGIDLNMFVHLNNVSPIIRWKAIIIREVELWSPMNIQDVSSSLHNLIICPWILLLSPL